MIDIPQAVLDALWALLIAAIGWIMAYIKAKEVKEAKAETAAVIDYFDPTEKGTEQPPAVIPARTYTMSEETKKWITTGETDADQKSILEQVAANEAKGLATYKVIYSKGYYDIEYGLIKGSGREGK